MENMKSISALAAEVNVPTDQVLRHVAALESEWGGGVILSYGAGGSDNVLLDYKAVTEIKRRFAAEKSGRRQY